MSRFRFTHFVGPTDARCDLNCPVAIALGRFDLSNAVWSNLHYGYWN
ncbi:hypothetical protein HRUBRA_02461 [Pseudohaliea rubra DSM 19751]|uniref:Uncharacterized protein n=1 Tax=Pseudohaliea rubra DSM 19751 TaxID=1265313 RepID=A0A095VNG1_9GAMM|nr:hypothetical protein HRUBRA_02461 [Pseudohaliea rubra DSM 19751]